MAETGKRGRGFSGMTPEKKREIASKGGKAAWAAGKAHKWTTEEAVRAGRLGGAISRRRSKNGVDSTEKAVKKQGGSGNGN